MHNYKVETGRGINIKDQEKEAELEKQRRNRIIPVAGGRGQILKRGKINVHEKYKIKKKRRIQ